MATSESNDICDICYKKHSTFMAVKWCPECAENLCEDCHVNHFLTEMSINAVIGNTNDRNIPDSVTQIKNVCGQHGMNYSNFCSQHDKLCCPACTTGSGSHSKCDTLPLQDVMKTANTSALLKSIEDSLNNLQKNIKAIIYDRKMNIRLLQWQRQQIEREIKIMKDRLLIKLYVMEKEIMEDLNSSLQQNTAQLGWEVADLEKRLKISEDLLISTSALGDLESNLQSYIGSKTMEAEVAKETNSLQELMNSRSIKRFNLRLEKASIFKFTVQTNTLFGRIVYDVPPVSFALKSDLDKQAQFMSLPSVVSIDDVKLSLRYTFQIYGNNNHLFGCSFIPPGKIVLANNGRSCIVVVKTNGDVENEIKVSAKPWDVTVLNNDTMAVSSDEGVKIINIATGNTEKTIPTGECHGLEYYNGSLICSIAGKGVVSADLTNNSMTTLVQDIQYMDYFYCTVNRDKIYVSRYSYHTISCYSIKGYKIWEYKDLSILLGPFGIAVDNNSNVYVATLSNSVVVLSHDGKMSRILLTEADGIISPRALNFNKSNNQLIVVNEQGKVCLYYI